VNASTINARRDREARAKAERREQLLDAAIAVVRERGPGVSMDQIATACGVTKPIIYRHFGDRDGLIMAIAIRFVAALVGALTPQLARRDAPQELLASTIDAYLRLIEGDTNLYRFLSANEPGKRDLVAGLIAEEVAGVLEQYLEGAGRDTAGAKPWAYGLVGMVHFTGDWWARTGTPSRSELVELLTELLWSGFDGIGLGEPVVESTSSPAADIPATNPATRRKRRSSNANGPRRRR
jgi:AcrR family transcriptional regulator